MACNQAEVEVSLLYMPKAKLIFIAFFIGAAFPFVALAASNANEASFDNLTLRSGNWEEKVSPEELYRWIEIKPVLYFRTSNKAEIENINYCPASSFLCGFLITERERLFVNKKSYSFFKEDRIRAYLEDLSRKVDKDPADAKLQIKDGKVSVFVLAENGIKLNVQKSLEIILENLRQSGNAKKDTGAIDLVCETLEPEIKSDSIDNMGITALIGEGKSNFRGSPKNRIFNIKVAASRFNGVLIKPEEEFSFVKILGEVDGEHGYLPELVIKKDKTEPEFGGGICQVSTTAFRAAIYSGLEITARRNHAYPVAYYNPQGMDATVYVPRPDLRFINNTPGYILIQTKIEGTELIFQFYGTSDGRTIEIEEPKILERNPDGSMKTTFTQRVLDKDGDIIIRDIFNSSYDSPAKYPHPGEEKFTKKPEDWSKKQWEEYKKANGM